MNIKIIPFLLAGMLVVMLAGQVSAKESEGSKFWKGPGGLLVGAGVIYWIISSNIDDVEDTKYSFYLKPNRLKRDLFIDGDNKNLEDYSVFITTRTNDKSLISPYAFAGSNVATARFTDNLLSINKSRVVGLGLKFNLDSHAGLKFEYSNFLNETELTTDNVALLFEYEF